MSREETVTAGTRADRGVMVAGSPIRHDSPALYVQAGNQRRGRPW
ncbi:MAG TPA: hypothetical protein VLC95_18610 [Anaerolineae bacterium]|nr:hypothetical protein [Anaerolineae bacterium]